MAPTYIELHGRKYALPRQPTVVVCVDGFDPEYLQRGCKDGILPNLSSFIQSGFHVTAKCAMPAVTNPNNVSIITGGPTAVHGISGNYYLDRETGEERMILDDTLMRGSTILAEMADHGVRVAAITAKDKLRNIINHGLSPKKGSIFFSSERAYMCTEEVNGISDVEKWLGRTTPPKYSADLSLFVLDAGLKLLEEERIDLFYLTLSDFILHKYPPGSPEANDFLHQVDARLGQFVERGAVVAVTADHGMSDKSNADGSPNVLWLEDELLARWPESQPRVICPIADPYVRHHGALGSFVRVYFFGQVANMDEIMQFCQTLPQVCVTYTGEKAAEIYEMPLDREGDLVVISKKHAVIGSKRSDHDLSGLKGFRLRSHGGLSEQHIPLLRSAPLPVTASHKMNEWRNFDAFDVALNWPNVKVESMDSTHNEKDASSLSFTDSKEALPLYSHSIDNKTRGRRIPNDPPRGQKWPVFAWIHGGFLQMGNPCHKDEAQPVELIAEDGAGMQAIVVAIGYRLNIFGFLAGNEMKGNFGFWDQRCALGWIQRYIHFFGGDKDQVTVGGLSAGAYSSPPEDSS
ncbi:hypothetical protein CNMCM5793_006206 [Aspergillus hiratsukae]|uniref:Carboxylic ester hydrolase n=1 Tax=Aspergillus hiratsukae TaxID=1194566 RepID=A0A8H6UHA2_9EURO|nr:hypothetical protein CNMCM5793_006206 [Aspergillus hiratsukae]